MASSTNKKRHRFAADRHSSASPAVQLSASDGTLAEVSQKFRRNSLPLPSIPGGFNDPSSADVILRLFTEPSPSDASKSDSDISADPDYLLYLHSSVLRRAKYFAASLSDRWTRDSSAEHTLNLAVSPTSSIHEHAAVIRLLYTNDYSTAIDSVSSALSILPIALKLLFEDCVKECVRFLECVPWSKDEEERILDFIPVLGEEEAKDLRARVSPTSANASEEMLDSLIITALHNHSNVAAAAKAFVASLLREFPDRETASSVLERRFSECLKAARFALEEYSSPDMRGNHGETEAVQRSNLHKAVTKCKHLVWLVERMIELRVADSAVKEWSEQASFAADLVRAFRDDAWKNITPGLPNMVLKCISKLVDSVASGAVLAPLQVRKQLVVNWLPVLIVAKDNAFSALPYNKPPLYSFRSMHPELEESFLKIISTLPMADAQELLQQCLSFATRDSESCGHLVKAFDTWFMRASTHPPLPSDSS